MKQATLKQSIIIFFIAFSVHSLFMEYSHSQKFIIENQNVSQQKDSIIPGLGGIWEGPGIENGLSELPGFYFDGRNFHFHETQERYVSGIITHSHMTGGVEWSDTGKARANIELIKK